MVQSARDGSLRGLWQALVARSVALSNSRYLSRSRSLQDGTTHTPPPRSRKRLVRRPFLTPPRRPRKPH